MKGKIKDLLDDASDAGFYPGMDKWESGTSSPKLAVQKMNNFRDSVGMPKMNFKQTETFLKKYGFR